MARHPRGVDEAISRFEAYAARLDGERIGLDPARRRQLRRSASAMGKRLATMGMAIAALIVATLAFGLFVSPIGWTGLFVVALAILAVLIFFTALPSKTAEKLYDEAMPNRQVVQSFDSFLLRRRAVLPAPAARHVDAISRQLPLLESRLGEVDALDPLAQDARRLMGKHLPELIERYERVPAAYRGERDGEGLTVDERLVASLDAAQVALGEIGAKLAKEDVNAFETKGRFIESRYRDPGAVQGE
jgi:hypothetical protein